MSATAVFNPTPSRSLTYKFSVIFYHERVFEAKVLTVALHECVLLASFSFFLANNRGEIGGLLTEIG